ncbi:protein TolR [Methylovirgula ligni]|uniref:Cell division and transport-associated protein TolR n=1 Tax=Methylovirgula ligni TaxID=569860 RepID=A0A3D9YWF0_9HYPH|nr:biopolymer transporter ExbD [Methylovirgula ligni]QAY95818.1 protein TolR [Methylovirgula ligni]REF86548.1 cell division and transport-associated protein TolR [Methylovirgula ligni]
MAFALRKHDSDFEAAPMSDMNVTPLVDVMLVLLIVFMVAAPLIAQGVPINLPKVQTKPLSDQKPPIGVSVDAVGQYYVDTKPVAPDQLVATLDAEDPTKDRRIHVRADSNLPYGQVVKVMGLINSAGFTKVALVSQQPGAGAPAASPGAAAAPAAVSAPAPAAAAGGAKP